MDVAGRKDVRDLVDDQMVFGLGRDRRLAAVDRGEVAHAEHRLHRVERTRVTHPGDRGHEVVRAPAMLREDADPFEGEERGIAREDDVRIEQVLERRSTRLNSSHITISYAVFCLKKKTVRD